MAVPEFPLINGESYSWSSIKAEVLGALLVGISAISFGEKDNKQNQYGIGRFPIARSYGNVEPNCSITMYKDTVLALQRVAPNGRISDIPPFDVTVAYVKRSGEFVKEVIRNFEFTENKVESSQGDNSIMVQIECICSHIDWAK